MVAIERDSEAILKLDNVLTNVEPLRGRKLRLTYRDGAVYVLDFTTVIAAGGVMAALADRAVFAEVRLGERGRSIEFPGGIDLCADALRVEAEAHAYGLPVPELQVTAVGAFSG